MHAPVAICAVLALLVIGSHAAPPAKKPAPKPQPTVKDLAIREARKCDTNYNGRIDGTEILALQAASKDPKSYLYLFDDNSNHSLDSAEVAKIRFKPATPKPKAPAGPQKPAKKP